MTHFIVHARKAILGGLSPAQNRSVPPLRHDFVYRLVKDFPDVDFTLNGGINTYEEVRVGIRPHQFSKWQVCRLDRLMLLCLGGVLEL